MRETARRVCSAPAARRWGFLVLQRPPSFASNDTDTTTCNKTNRPPPLAARLHSTHTHTHARTHTHRSRRKQSNRKHPLSLFALSLARTHTQRTRRTRLGACSARPRLAGLVRVARRARLLFSPTPRARARVHRGACSPPPFKPERALRASPAAPAQGPDAPCRPRGPTGCAPSRRWVFDDVGARSRGFLSPLARSPRRRSHRLTTPTPPQNKTTKNNSS